MPETAKLIDPVEGATVHTINSWNDFTRRRSLGILRKLAEKKRLLAKEEKLLHQDIINQGGTIKELQATLKLEGLEPKAVEKAERERIACMRVAGLPIGTQMGFFDGPANVTAQLDENQRAYEAGLDDGWSGRNADEQKYPPGTQAGEHYLNGWNEGQAYVRGVFLDAQERALQPSKTSAEIAAEKAKAREDKAAAKAKAAEDKKANQARAKADKLAEKAAKAKDAADAAAKEVGDDDQVDLEEAIDEAGPEEAAAAEDMPSIQTHLDRRNPPVEVAA